MAKDKKPKKGPQPKLLKDQIRDAELIRVRITATCRVQYNQVRMMLRSEWESRKQGKPEYLADKLDPTDIFDAEAFEDVEAEVVDAEGKVVDSGDCYPPHKETASG